MVFYAWFIVAKEYITGKASLHTGFFGKDWKLKRETDFFILSLFKKMLVRALLRVSHKP